MLSASLLRAFLSELEKSAADPLRQQLMECGPPNEWSGAVAGMLGPERRKQLTDLWKAMSPAEREVVQRAFSAQMDKKAEVEYRGKTFSRYNHPVPSDKKDKKMMVLAKKGDQVKLVHFGQKGYKHNYSPEAKENYLKRSAGIRNKNGELTKNDVFSPNYWARRVLWPSGRTGDGHSGPVDLDVRDGAKNKE